MDRSEFSRLWKWPFILALMSTTALVGALLVSGPLDYLFGAILLIVAGVGASIAFKSLA
ncbi:MAG: hypothetical protein AAFQ12_06950 [Pseudomonadota bacterium]